MRIRRPGAWACLASTLACAAPVTIGTQLDDGGADSGAPAPDGGDAGAVWACSPPCGCGQVCSTTGEQTMACRAPSNCESLSDCAPDAGWACLPALGGCSSLCLMPPTAPAACASDADCPCGSFCTDAGGSATCRPVGPACTTDPDCAALGYPCVKLYRAGGTTCSVCMPMQ